jgi:heme exporter protein B
MPRSDPTFEAGGGRLYLMQVLQIMAKDLRVELRSREILYTMAFFAVLVVVIFSFAFARQGQPMHDVAGGILWVVVAFAGTLGLTRFFDREREGDTYRALLLCPTSSAVIYLGKLLGVCLFTASIELIVVPLLIMLFNLKVSSVGLLILLMVLGTVGFAAVGALFSASLMNTRSRDVLLSILLFPIVTPVIVAGAKGTAALMTGSTAMTGALVWIKLLAVFDLIFITLSLWAFGPLTRSE